MAKVAEEPRRSPTGSMAKVVAEEPRRPSSGSKLVPEGTPRRAPTGAELRAADGDEPPASETTRFKVVSPVAGQVRFEELPEQETMALPAARPPRPPPQPRTTNTQALLGGFVGVALVAAVGAVVVLRSGEDEPVRPLATVGSVQKGDGTRQMQRVSGGLPPIEVRPVEAEPTAIGPIGGGAPKPGDGEPVAVKPSDLTAVEPKPVDVKPADAKPVDANAADVKPSNAQPADTKPADVKVATAPVDPKPQTGALDVNCVPWCKVFIDGRDLKRTSPARGIVLPAGRHALKVLNPDTGLEMERSVTIRAGATAQEVIKF
jgi:hypothetical protein